MKAFCDGLGQYVHVEIVSAYTVDDFNTQLTEKLDDGWRVISDVDITRMPDNKSTNVVYTCMIAKKRFV